MRVTPPLMDVVSVLLDAPEHELHGWAIMRGSQRSGPAVYRALETLTDAGWVAPRWDDQGNEPRRRFYRLTPDGIKRAETLQQERSPAARWFRPAFGSDAL